MTSRSQSSSVTGHSAKNRLRDDFAFASVTVHCAQCHAHKFDPISQADYYSLQAVFAAVDRAELRAAGFEIGDLPRNHDPAPLQQGLTACEVGNPCFSRLPPCLVLGEMRAPLAHRHARLVEQDPLRIAQPRYSTMAVPSPQEPPGLSSGRFSLA